MKLVLDNIEINYEIINKNNKNIYFRFKEDNVLYVYCHKRVNSQVEKMIIDNKDSILKMVKSSLNKREDSDCFYYLGDKYLINYSDIDGVLFEGDELFVRDSKALKKFYDKELVRIFNDRVNVINEMFTDIPRFTLKIRKMKTRWGVCNFKMMTITLNSELLKRKLYLLDYVIIHEICHFYEANHQKKFWSHVERYYPDYKKARKELKESL